MYILIVYYLFMMARKNINFETPAKKLPKQCYWYSDSPLKRVTKDLFGVTKELCGVRKSRLKNAKSPLIFVKTLNTNKYLLMGSKKRLKTPDMVQCGNKRLYIKCMQDRELKKPTAYEGMLVFDMALWKKLATHYYRDDAAKAKANHKAKGIFCCQKQ